MTRDNDEPINIWQLRQEQRANGTSHSALEHRSETPVTSLVSRVSDLHHLPASASLDEILLNFHALSDNVPEDNPYALFGAMVINNLMVEYRAGGLNEPDFSTPNACVYRDFHHSLVEMNKEFPVNVLLERMEAFVSHTIHALSATASENELETIEAFKNVWGGEGFNGTRLSETFANTIKKRERNLLPEPYLGENNPPQKGHTR